MTIGISKKTNVQPPQNQNIADTKAVPEVGAGPNADKPQLDADTLAKQFAAIGLPVQSVRSKKDDTLQKLARETGIPLNVLQMLNPDLPAKEALPADTALKIPGGRKNVAQSRGQAGQAMGPLLAQLKALLEAILNGDTAALQALAGGGGNRGPSPRAGIPRQAPAAGAAAAPGMGMGAAAPAAAALGGLGAGQAMGGRMPAEGMAPGMNQPAANAPLSFVPPQGAIQGPGAQAPATGAGAPQQIAATGSGPARLGRGFESLNQLSGQLANLDGRFNPNTAKGRAAQALALAIGGTEVYSKGSRATDFFTRRGGTGNNMLGFGQFNLAYHAGKTNTPGKYTKFMGDILTGQARMPNSRRGGDHAANLVGAVESGQVRNGNDLKNWMQQNGFGGSNWQGIDDGWSRVPGLGDQLVNFIRGGAAANPANA